MFVQFVAEGRHGGHGGAEDVVGHAVVLGKVEGRLDVRGGSNERVSPSLVPSPERAAGLRERLATLRRRLGVEKVREALRLGEVELIVVERAPGEFAGLGGADDGGGGDEDEEEEDEDERVAAVARSVAATRGGRRRARASRMPRTTASEPWT